MSESQEMVQEETFGPKPETFWSFLVMVGGPTPCKPMVDDWASDVMLERGQDAAELLALRLDPWRAMIRSDQVYVPLCRFGEWDV